MPIMRKAQVDAVIEAFTNLKAKTRKDILRAQELAEERERLAKEKAAKKPR